MYFYRCSLFTIDTDGKQSSCFLIWLFIFFFFVIPKLWQVLSFFFQTAFIHRFLFVACQHESKMSHVQSFSYTPTVFMQLKLWCSQAKVNPVSQNVAKIRHIFQVSKVPQFVLKWFSICVEAWIRLLTAAFVLLQVILMLTKLFDFNLNSVTESSLWR